MSWPLLNRHDTSDSKRTDIILTLTAVQHSLIKCSILRITFQDKITQGIWVITFCLAEVLQILSTRREVNCEDLPCLFQG